MPKAYPIDYRGERSIVLEIPGLLLRPAQAEELVRSIEVSLNRVLDPAPLPSPRKLRPRPQQRTTAKILPPAADLFKDML